MTAVTLHNKSLLDKALAVPYHTIIMPEWEKLGIQVFLRRDDLIDEALSGNKYYKLFYNLEYAIKQKKSTIVSYGGAYSNHLHALAIAGRKYNLQTIGVIRGERPQVLNSMLMDVESMGMRLEFISRAQYKAFTENPSLNHYPKSHYIIPEGGANNMGIKGTQVIGTAIEQSFSQHYDFVCVPCGTGGTMAGIIAGLPNAKTVVGFSVLKGAGQMFNAQMQNILTGGCHWRLIRGFHGGGYAKKLPDYLVDFWQAFERYNNILLDPVYTLKMLWGIHALIMRGYWSCGTRLIAVHTGGVQGRRGFAKQISW